MNCIWLLLILFCCGNNNCCGNTWSNGCNNCRRCNDNDDYDYDRRDNTCENVCEAACEAARDAVYDNSDQGCGCGRRSFPFTSYPVLDSCD